MRPGPLIPTRLWPLVVTPTSPAVTVPPQPVVGLPLPVIVNPLSRSSTSGTVNEKHGVPSATSQVTSPVRSVLATIENVLVMVPETESGRPCRVRPTETAPTMSRAVSKTRVRMRPPLGFFRV